MAVLPARCLTGQWTLGRRFLALAPLPSVPLHSPACPGPFLPPPCAHLSQIHTPHPPFQILDAFVDVPDVPAAAEIVYVVGPLDHPNLNHQVLLCPECDDDRVTGLAPDVTRVCTTEWLVGQMLEGDENLDRVQCECFRQNPWPYEEFPEVPQKRRRFYHYRTVAWKLGLGPKERADLPGCVKDRIEEDYGDSEVGFRARFPR